MMMFNNQNLTSSAFEFMFQFFSAFIICHLLHEPDAELEERYTAPLVQLLEKFNVPKQIDYLGLDVEGAEHLIMKNFPFETYHIKIMTVERPSTELRRLLEAQGFVFLKDLAWWGETLWAHQSAGFTPEHLKVKAIKTEEGN